MKASGKFFTFHIGSQKVSFTNFFTSSTEQLGEIRDKNTCTGRVLVLLMVFEVLVPINGRRLF